MSKELKIGLNIDTQKMIRKLKIISKHAELLAIELENVDKTCDCGSEEFEITDILCKDGMKKVRTCICCGDGEIIDYEER